MSFGDYLENAVLDAAFGGTSMANGGTLANTLYVGLSTTNPGDAGTSITEPVGAEYTRVEVLQNGTNWNASASGTKDNATAITFATATSAWGTVTHFFIMSSGSATANLICHGTLDTAKVVTTNDVVRFAAGSLNITLD